MTFPRSSRRFVPSLLALPLLVAAPPLLCVARAQDAAVTAPKAAVVSQISAQSATLSVGQKDGAQAGAVYSLSQGGAEVLRVQITEVRADDSVCRVVSLAPGADGAGRNGAICGHRSVARRAARVRNATRSRCADDARRSCCARPRSFGAARCDARRPNGYAALPKLPRPRRQ